MTSLARSLALIVFGLGVALSLPEARADVRHPLLIEGKTELFQRVLTRPGAQLTAVAGAPSKLDPFTPLFVYGRQPRDGGAALLEVGTDAKGKVIGFLPETDAVEWSHALVLAFSQPIGRERTLFFKDKAGLESWQDSPELLVKAREARSLIDAGTLPAGSPVVSIEPKEFIDFEKNFYMLPILQAERKRLNTGFRVRNVEVASVTSEETSESREQPLKRRMNVAAMADFRAGVVFVIDASSSMDPYIDKTRQVMDDVLKRVQAEGLADKVRFGLIAFRDDPKKVKGVEYLTRTFADPNSTADAKAFAKAIAPLKATAISTRAFAEDSFAAIDTALNTIDWSGFAARYLILVTDASSRGARAEIVDGKTVPPSATLLDVEGMNQLVRGKKAALYAFHLKTPAGAADHARAEAQYRILSRYENAPSLYYPVPAGDEAAFGAAVTTLADALVAQVRDAEKTLAEPDAAQDPKPVAKGPLDLTQSARMVGRAMALAHLGRAEGVAAPSMFRAWASDRDFANPETANFSVRVLLSKNQLSDLQKTLQLTVEALEKGQIDPGDFFNQLRSAALSAGRDPSKVGQGTARNMESAGLVSEYLDGLPYQSRLMGLSQDDWIAMGVAEQQAIIDATYAKVQLYQKYHDDNDHWIALTPGAEPGDTVFPVPIDSLP
ncbi:serine/threonine protein kinase [Rhodospirillum rubrum]|uniref:vWA domain-containing protein n=1 Tax=Rhodospirillum rubrum TaxID=1085 RepID=UPI001905DC96|nr:vWA domain-containing protein [Rhodospirillum rubrum]MBK1665463.1 serine/threonine protein kinase [Rhodospirillum rubrum]MBK1678156.1 serine/threonine protein kinase [Rhodospirillum rubrum]